MDGVAAHNFYECLVHCCAFSLPNVPFTVMSCVLCCQLCAMGISIGIRIWDRVNFPSLIDQKVKWVLSYRSRYTAVPYLLFRLERGAFRTVPTYSVLCYTYLPRYLDFQTTCRDACTTKYSSTYLGIPAVMVIPNYFHLCK